MNKKNKNKRSTLIPINAAENKTKNVYLNKNLTVLDSWKENGNQANIFLSLRFIQFDHQCFSEWGKEEMKKFWLFQEQLHNHSWQQLYSQSGKTQKTGFGYTNIEKSQYPNSIFRNQLSDDITLFELRIDNKIRIHGFRHESFFYAFWLDKNHDLLK
jgi:hypothetical protein